MAKVVKVVTNQDIGKGLEIVANKLQVAIDNQSLVIEDGKLKAVAETTVDLRVTGIKADKADSKLKITVSAADGGNATTVETTLADLMLISKEADNLAVAKDDGIHVAKADVVSAAKEVATVEFQDLAGNTLGYAFETNA